jgi:hypothetical protein
LRFSMSGFGETLGPSRSVDALHVNRLITAAV